MHRRAGGGCLALLLAAGLAHGAETVTAPSPAAAPLSFGIVPQQTPTRLARLWTPLLEELGHRSGVRLDFRTAPDITIFDQRVAAGEYDIVYVNPHKYSRVHRNPGYRAFAREDGYLQGLIVVRADNPITSIAQLHGQVIAFPSPNAFAAAVLPLAELKKRSIEVAPSYVGSHESVYLTVAQGLHGAGGGVRRTLDQMPPDTRDRLRILWMSDPFVAHAIAAHPRVPRRTIERLQRTMIDLNQDAAGRALLHAVGFSGIVAAEDREWNDIRAPRIEQPQPRPRGGSP